MQNQEQKPQETPQAETGKPAAADKKKVPEKKERPEACVGCNKSLKKRWYYREGSYYCGKSCWKKSKKSK